MMKTTVLAENIQFPEGPRWHAGKLWFSDIFAQRVMNMDVQGHLETVVELPDSPSGLGWTPDGKLLIVSTGARQLLRLDEDGLTIAADLSSLASDPCNDMVVDRYGRAYIGNFGYDFGNPEAAPQLAPIFLVDPQADQQGKVRVAADGLATPNGMVITPDGQTLIVAESNASRLTAFTIQSDGSLTNRRVWAQFAEGAAETQVTPDGICLDAEGAVWVASPYQSQVLRVQEGGKITQRILMDSVALACMLGGPDRRTLFIMTTSSLDGGDGSITGRIETLPVEVPGAGLP